MTVGERPHSGQEHIRCLDLRHVSGGAEKSELAARDGRSVAPTPIL